jgi:hypothetical protein
MSKSLRKTIAETIKKADSSYFFEDYTKQANAVMEVMVKEGYKIVPLQPTEEMIKIGLDNLPSGRVKPEELIKRIYTAMVKGG